MKLTSRQLRLAASLLVLSFCGCAPYRFTARPGASGRVIDARSRKPIAGATVFLTVRHMDAWSHSAADGSFLLPPEHRWRICIVGEEPANLDVHVSFGAGGYISTSRQFLSSSFGPAMTQLGDIKMQTRK